MYIPHKNRKILEKKYKDESLFFEELILEKEDAFLYLYIIAIDRCRTEIKKYKFDKHLLNDFYNETVIEFLEKNRKGQFQFQGTKALVNYFLGIFKSKVLNESRLNSRHSGFEDKVVSHFESFSKNLQDPHEIIEIRERNEDLWNSVLQLASPWKEIIIGYYYLDMDLKELYKNINHGYANRQVLANARLTAKNKLAKIYAKIKK